MIVADKLDVFTIHAQREWLNYKDEDGLTPLHVACANGAEKFVEIILALGAGK